jgi:uncharacterized protein (TIGR02118 family)
LSIHLVFLYRCRRDVGRDRFLQHWADVHAPLVKANPSIRRYVRNVVLPTDDNDAWHGAEELWVDDEDAADAFMHDSASGDGPLADESLFVDTEAVVRLRTKDHTVVDGKPVTQDESLPKRMTFLKRKPGMSRGELVSYWRYVHGPLAGSVPGVRRYVQSSVVASEFDKGEPPFDGVAQIWLDDADTLRAIIASPLFREKVKPDEGHFVATEPNVTLAMEEHREIWPGGA